MWNEVDDFLSRKLPMERFHEQFAADHATEIIQTIRLENGRRFYINTRNNGSVSNLPDDAYLELLCAVDREGPHPVPTGDMPLGIRGLQMRILDTHELTVEAALKRDRNLVRRALLTDPLVESIAVAEKVMDALFEKEAEALAWPEEETGE